MRSYTEKSGCVLWPHTWPYHSYNVHTNKSNISINRTSPDTMYNVPIYWTFILTKDEGESKNWKIENKAVERYLLGITQLLQTLSPGYGCLHKTGLVPSHLEIREGLKGTLFLPDELLTTNRFQGRDSHCLLLCIHWWTHQAPTDSSQTTTAQTALVNSVGSKIK